MTSPHDDLDDWVTAAKAGDERAFARLYRALQPPVLRYLRVGAGPDAADDLASEVWHDVARGLGRFTGDGAGFRAWIFTIARHRLVDWRRAASRRPADAGPVSALADVAGADDPAATVGATEEALRLIALLPADQAEVVALRFIAGLDVAEVAEIVGKRPGAVRVAAHRGLRRLGEVLGEKTSMEV